LALVERHKLLQAFKETTVAIQHFLPLLQLAVVGVARVQTLRLVAEAANLVVLVVGQHGTLQQAHLVVLVLVTHHQLHQAKGTMVEP
jgi:hypothetical protein